MIDSETVRRKKERSFLDRNDRSFRSSGRADGRAFISLHFNETLTITRHLACESLINKFLASED